MKTGKVWQELDLIFCSCEGKPLIPCDLQQRHFKPLLKGAGLPDIRMYDLRHTCATLLLAANVPAKVVQERLGHSSISITLDCYSHVLPDMQDKATEAFEAVMAKAKKVSQAFIKSTKSLPKRE